MNEIVPIIGSLSFMVAIVMFVLCYKKKKKKMDFKKHLILGISAMAVSMILVGISSANSVTKITLQDIQLYKGKTAKVIIKTEPKDAMNSADIMCTPNNSKIATIKDNRITAVSEGDTEYTCKVGEITSNTVKVSVKLSEAQRAELEAKNAKAEQEKLEKAAKEAEEKQAETEANRNELSTEESIRLKDYAKKTIDSALKAPSTSEYPGSLLNPLKDWSMSKSNNLVTIVSYVDSQNSFGAMIRSNFIMQVQMSDDGSGNATYVELDGNVLLGSYQ